MHLDKQKKTDICSAVARRNRESGVERSQKNEQTTKLSIFLTPLPAGSWLSSVRLLFHALKDRARSPGLSFSRLDFVRVSGACFLPQPSHQFITEEKRTRCAHGLKSVGRAYVNILAGVALSLTIAAWSGLFP